MTRILMFASALTLFAAAPGRAGAPQQPTAAKAPTTQTCTLKISGMTCASCDVAVRLAAKSVAGVATVTVDYPKGKAEVTYDPSETNPQAIAAAITKRSGFKAEAMKPAQK